MFKIKNLVHDIKSVPVPFIFEHYCKLKEKLEGQDVKIKSLFNAKDRTPSMCIYFDVKNNVYKFKDFSTGKQGSAVELVKELLGVNYHIASRDIVEKYNDFVLHNNGGYDIKEFKQASKYKLEKVTYRTWSTQDQYFWTQFNIGSTLLNHHNVRPLDSYTLIKDDKELTIKSNYLYGYHSADGSLYKIYQPKTQDRKFLKIADYIQGSEQLQNHPFLVITSSLKDIMALKSLKLNVDIVAPDSENSMIKDAVMKHYLETYQKVIVLFDNDEPGIKAAEKYRQIYPTIHPIVLTMSKDPSDSIRDHGPKEVIRRIVPLIEKNL